MSVISDFCDVCCLILSLMMVCIFLVVWSFCKFNGLKGGCLLTKTTGFDTFFFDSSAAVVD